MSVSSTIRTIGYTGNGVATTFATTFPFQEANDLAVKVATVLKTLGVDYNVTGGGPGVATGNVVFVAAPANLAAIVITRTTDLTQATSLRTQGSFSPAVHENAFDKLTEIAQELAARITTLEGGSTNNATAGNGLLNTAGTWSVKPQVTGGLTVDATGVALLYNDVQANPGVFSDASGQSAGASPYAAREDHVHVALTAVAGTAQVGDAAAQGAATSLVRSDHKHAFPAPGAPPATNTDAAAAAAGTSLKFAREDHASVLATAAPTTISDSTSTQGTATTGVRSDHVHPHGNRGGGALHSVATQSIAGFESAADKLKLDSMGTNALQGTVQTNDGATATTLIDLGAIGAGQATTFLAQIAGLRSDASAGAGYHAAATFRNNGGVVSQVGATTTMATHADAATAFSFVISTNHVLLKVNGIAAQTWNWRASALMTTAP